MSKKICLLLFSLLFSALHGEPALQTTFHAACKPCSQKSKGEFSGVLPKDWNENFTSWNRSKASGFVVKQADEEFFRFKSEYIDNDACVQFIAPVKLDGGRNYALKLRYRSALLEPAEIQIRQKDAPYKTYWSMSLQCVDAWSEASAVFRTTYGVDYTDAIALIKMSSLGFLDLDSIDISETNESPTPNPKLARPSVDSRNFLRNSSLPLGLQAGWCLGRQYGQAATVSDELGTSGEKAFAISNGRLNSAPFLVADPGARNQVSFYYKGHGDWSAYAYGAKSISLQASANEWRRAVIPLDPALEGRGYVLVVRGKGELLLDAFHAGPAGSDFSPSGKCEISLAVPESATSSQRLQFENEKPLLKYYVAGWEPGIAIRPQATDLYGRTTVLPEACGKSGIIDFGDAIGPNASGQFRIEATAYDARGKQVSLPSELTVTRLPKPMFWGRDAENSPFGCHAEANETALILLKAAGVNWIRLHDAGVEHVGWRFIEPERNVWRFHDKEIMTYRNHGMKLLAELGTAPSWAAKNMNSSLASEMSAYLVPKSMDEFSNYIFKLAERYNGVIDEYFIWNEPWGQEFLPSGTIESNAAVFEQMQQVAHETIKRVNPAIKVSGFNTRPNSDWSRLLMRNPRNLASCDMVDYHLYSNTALGQPHDFVEEANSTAVGCILAQCPGKPVYMSEGQGVSTGVGRDDSIRFAGMSKYAVTWENSENYWMLADRTIRFMARLLSLGSEKIFLYSAHTYNNFAAPPNFLALLQADGFAHPQLVAHSAFAKKIEGKRFVTSRKVADGIYGYSFEGEGGAVVVVLPVDGNASSMLLTSSISGASAYDIWGNPRATPFNVGRFTAYFEANCRAVDLLASIKAMEPAKR